MRKQDTVRRTITVALVSLCLVLVPAWASALYTGNGNANVQVGTFKLEPVTGVTGTAKCGLGFFTESISFRVTGFGSTAVPKGTVSYQYTVTEGNSSKVLDQFESSSKAVTANGSQTIDVGATDWNLTVRTIYKATASSPAWTSDPTTVTVSCRAGDTRTYDL